jgi:peptidoglycan/LPS O-acetylase OafA/YrhL
MLLLAAWKTSEGLRIITLIQGGYREIMGTFFFGVGFLFRKWEQHYRVSWWMTIVFAVIVALYSQYLTANMNWRSSFIQFLSLPVPAICGFLMTYNIATWLNRYDGVVKRFLVFCGDNTLPIFVFHIISFKLVSLLKIWYYDLDFAQIGCHMVIHDHAKDDFFWILYTIVGVGIPLGFTWCSQHIRKAQQPPSSLPAAD